MQELKGFVISLTDKLKKRRLLYFLHGTFDFNSFLEDFQDPFPAFHTQGKYIFRNQFFCLKWDIST